MPPKNKIHKQKVQGAESDDTPIKSDTVAMTQLESTPVDDNQSEEEQEIALTPEEDLFITYLLAENMNRTRAYLRGHPNITVESATASASRMLRRVNVQAELNRRMTEEAMSEEEGVMRLTRIARGMVTPFLKEGPDGFMYFDLSHPDAAANMYLIKEMETKRERRLVGSGESAEEWEGEWVKVKLHDAYIATVDLLKIYGKFTKKVDLTSGGEPLQKNDQEGFDRSLNTFAEVIKGILGEKEDKA